MAWHGMPGLLALCFYFVLNYVLCIRESMTSLKIVKKKVFVDERWSQNRNVTAMDWSSHVSPLATPPTPRVSVG